MIKIKYVHIALLLVFLITLLVFLPTLSGDFISQDDALYVVTNPLVRHLDRNTVLSAFMEAHCGWWMPFTWLSFAIDYHLWGLDPFGYHLTNILLHAVNAGLVVLIASLLCGEMLAVDNSRRGRVAYGGFLVFAGLLFGLHPLRVESVAWIAERKDVLNGIFALGAIACYLGYVRGKTIYSVATTRLLYSGSLLLFTFSLLAKSSSVGLPLMLLVLDWYPLGRLKQGGRGRVLLEKIPFIAVAAAVALVTLYFARTSGYLVTYEAFPFTQRLVVSGNSLWEYWRMFFLPVNISPLHVIPDPIPFAYGLKAAVAGALLVAVAFCRVPWLQATTLCFLLPVFPVLGFFQNGDQSFAARFTYLASLAQTIPVAVFVYRAACQEYSPWLRRLTPALASLLLVLAVSVTFTHFSFWQNSEAYWTRVIELEPLAINYKERGRLYLKAGRNDAAIADFTAALQRLTVTLQPFAYNFYGFRAEALRAAGRPEEAVRDFTMAIAGLPHPAYFYHRGLALQALGRQEEAAADFRRAGPEPGPVSWFD